MKKFFSKTIAVFISLLLVLSIVPVALFSASAVDESELSFGVMSDLHYYPSSLMGSDINKFIEVSKLASSTSYLTETLLDAALDQYEQQALTKNLKYILIPGDLSKNGEYEALAEVAQKLKDFENRTGIQVLVINGNHDIRNNNAAKFVNGEFVSTKYTEPEEFRSMFGDLGYDLADSFYTPPAGEQAGQLSYAATLEGGYRLIALDGGCYSSDSNSKGENKAETRGAYSKELYEWALNEIEKAEAEGLTVIGMTHFNLVEHFEHEDCTFTAFPIENWQEICESFADAGMHYAFTGHLHFQDIASWTSDNGETMTDCSTASLINFPNYLRTVTLDNTAADGSVTATYENHDIDELTPITAYGVTYDKPFRNTSFALNFGGSNINEFAVNMVDYNVRYVLTPQIHSAGGLYNYLDNMLDLDSVIDSLLSNTNLGQLDGVTKTSIKAVLKTACVQLQLKYIENPDHTREVVSGVVQRLTSIKVSSYPCTKFIDTLGFGNTSSAGNLGDLVSSCLAYMYLGDENKTGDLFVNDALARFERGETAQEIFDTLLDVVLNDLLKDEILPTLQFDPVKFFMNFSQDQKDDILTSVFGSLFDSVGEVNDAVPKISAGDIVSVVFALGVTDYSSLEDIVNHYLDEYMTESQMDTIAYEFYNYVNDFTTDKAPSDNSAVVSYNGPVSVTPSVSDLRLPSAVAVTFGNDASTSRNICWYTKVGVTGTDIEIIPYSSNPKFTGTPTVSGITAKTVRTTREYPGIDFGIFGIINYEFNINRHMIQVEGLKPGTKYCYRVGDAQRGWWSQTGVIETADNSDEFTFLHMSDSQGGIERQYQVWANTVAAAYDLYPEASFIMHTGDAVDSGSNFKQWNWALNTASSSLMNTVLMPTSGNHEKSDSAITNNFLISGAPEQETETGVYYSFNYNNAHFMVLNTNDLNDDGSLSDEQLEWLKNDANSSDKQWKIVALHKAVYSNGSHYDDDDVTALRAQLSTLMPELDVDLVLQGHDHVYLRTGAMNGNACEEVTEVSLKNNGETYQTMVKPNGTVYAIDGCAGVKYYQTKDVAETDTLFPRAEAIYDAVTPMFAAIRIDGDRLYFDAYSVDNGITSLIDSFAIGKDESLANSTGAGSGSTIFEDDLSVPGIHIPKTAGNVIKTTAFLIPIAAAAAATACIVRKKKEEI